MVAQPQTVVQQMDGRMEGPLYIKATNTGDQDFFGKAVAADGDTFAVGAPSEDSASADDPGDDSLSNSGAVHVYVRDENGDWMLQAFLKADNAGIADNFGAALALSGDTLVVGAPGESSDASGVNGDGSNNNASLSGAAYVFVRDEQGQWTQQAYLKASNPDVADLFGSSVDISGDRIVVGAPFEDSFSIGVDGNQLDNTVPDSGAAYVFQRDGSGQWSQEGYLKASNTAANDLFGSSVGIHIDVVVVGAPLEDSASTGVNSDADDDSSPDAGAAYLFFHSQGQWNYGDYLKPSVGYDGARFGDSVAIYARDVIVGAPQHGAGATGAAFLFKENVRFTSATFESAYIEAPNAEFGDWFGERVDANNDRIVIGARNEDSGSAGVDGNQEDNSVSRAGAAYVYETLPGGAFRFTGYLKASNPGADDYFGSGDVAIGAESVIVGAHLEDSSATGIDGNQGDDSQSSSGAAYVFEAPSIEVFEALVVGRQGDGMKVRFNGGDERTISNYLAFPDQPLFAGDFYSFEITQQPANPDQICEPISISGVVNGPLGTQTVTCPPVPPPPSFLVGGNVSGLAGSGLVLRLNDSDDLAVNGNGPFVFTEEVEQSASYGVTIAVQPSGPDQICQANPGAGIIGDEPVTDIEVRCVEPLPATDYGFEEYIKSANTEAFDHFAAALALDGETLAVGADGEDSAIGGIGGPPGNNAAISTGAVYVYTRDSASNWSSQSYIKASNPDDGDEFGLAVALSGDTLAIGAPGEDSNATGFNGNQFDDSLLDSGAVYILTRNAMGAWFYEGYLKASNTGSEDGFGSALALDGDTLVVGAPAEDSASVGVNSAAQNDDARNSGAAYVFVRSGTTWTQQAYLKPDNTDANDAFGSAVAVDGNRIVVSSPSEASAAIGVDGDRSNNSAPASGAAYVFERFEEDWSQTAYLKPLDTTSGDVFGTQVDLEGDRIAISAAREDGPGDAVVDAGSVYLFEYDGIRWKQAAQLRADNAGPDDQFGIDLDLDGDRLIVGAWLEDSGSAGVGANGDDDTVTNSGAAYLFRWFDGGWQQERYIKPPVVELSDQFGRKVGLSNGLIAVGSIAEDGSSIGVGGDLFDNGASTSGGVWTFDASRYTIGGQVSGLAGSGLVLRLNGDQFLPIAGNGAFQFPTPLAVGSSYRVEIESAPMAPDQSCVVVNGSGLLGPQPVTDLQIQCSSGFTIGGSVSGVAGPGLLLRNGDDPLLITSNGSFEFEQSVADGQSYDVTIVSTPTSPPQQCEIVNGSGRVQGQPVNDIQVQCQTFYRVRGQVRGVAGPGLVLQNNGGDDRTITSNGLFQFSTLLANGAAYSVTVSSSPGAPPQSCSVTNGSGTIQGQNVTDVLIDCVTFYAIGGSIAGVAGPGLVLQNNGGDDRSILANGPFRFDQLQLQGSNYDVTILSEPADPEQLCRVLDGAGTVGFSDVDSVRVQCRRARRVGGTVSGLVGSGLLLELNSSDPLSIIGNGAFQFPQPVPDGTPYAVTLAALPQSPEQECMIENGVGTASGGDVDDVLVSCETIGQPGSVQFRTSLVEVDETAGTLTLELDRVGGVDGAISARVVSQAVTAEAGVDFVAVDESRSWTDGDASSWMIGVSLIDDGNDETTERFDLVLSIEAGGASVGTPGRVSITIFDDETVWFANGFED